MASRLDQLKSTRNDLQRRINDPNTKAYLVKHYQEQLASVVKAITAEESKVQQSSQKSSSSSSVSFPTQTSTTSSESKAEPSVEEKKEVESEPASSAESSVEESNIIRRGTRGDVVLVKRGTGEQVPEGKQYMGEVTVGDDRYGIFVPPGSASNVKEAIALANQPTLRRGEATYDLQTSRSETYDVGAVGEVAPKKTLVSFSYGGVKQAVPPGRDVKYAEDYAYVPGKEFGKGEFVPIGEEKVAFTGKGLPYYTSYTKETGSRDLTREEMTEGVGLTPAELAYRAVYNVFADPDYEDTQPIASIVDPDGTEYVPFELARERLARRAGGFAFGVVEGISKQTQLIQRMYSGGFRTISQDELAQFESRGIWERIVGSGPGGFSSPMLPKKSNLIEDVSFQSGREAGIPTGEFATVLTGAALGIQEMMRKSAERKVQQKLLEEQLNRELYEQGGMDKIITQVTGIGSTGANVAGVSASKGVGGALSELAEQIGGGGLSFDPIISGGVGGMGQAVVTPTINIGMTDVLSQAATATASSLMRMTDTTTVVFPSAGVTIEEVDYPTLFPGTGFGQQVMFPGVDEKVNVFFPGVGEEFVAKFPGATGYGQDYRFPGVTENIYEDVNINEDIYEDLGDYSFENVFVDETITPFDFDYDFTFPTIPPLNFPSAGGWGLNLGMPDIFKRKPKYAPSLSALVANEFRVGSEPEPSTVFSGIEERPIYVEDVPQVMKPTKTKKEKGLSVKFKVGKFTAPKVGKLETEFEKGASAKKGKKINVEKRSKGFSTKLKEPKLGGKGFSTKLKEPKLKTK